MAKFKAPLFELVRGTQRIWGPSEWKSESVRPVIQSLGLDPNLTPIDVSGYSRLSKNVFIYPVKHFAPELKNRLQVFSPNQKRIIENNTVIYRFERIEAESDFVIAKMLKDLSGIQEKDLGRTMTYEEASVLFDLQTLTTLTAYLNSWQIGEGVSTEWRSKGTDRNVIPLYSEEAVSRMLSAVTARRAASFNTRAVIEKEILALQDKDDRGGMASYKIGARFEELLSN